MSSLRRRLLTALLLALAASPAAADGGRVDERWGQAQGLMAGITVTHAIQPIAAAFDEIPWKDKYFVSIGGAALYGTTFVGLMFRQKWALYVALIGPAVGLTAVMTGWVLDETGVIDASIRPDVFQIGGGVLQAAAWLVCFDLLHIDPRWQVTVQPVEGGGVLGVATSL